ncbi:endonuclease/exonuclease/phosphatase [Flavobacterium psychrophilum]|nr:endonuclease/exonuclease/phosphatase [Flavobacterium psychrophilum]AOE51658.1 endonuclease/exonuclease/phosphatase [Flavobacterium psychrophilum]
MKQIVTSIILIFTFASTTAQNVKVMSYNIRLDVASDGENRWDNRKDMLTAQVLKLSPDFMGVQEALPQQIDYLNANLKGYKYIGVGRDDGKRDGEFSAIFYNASQYKMLQQSTFWLSETPDKASFGWDAACRRVCTYGLFENSKTKKKIWIFNTHFDHIGDVARVNSARMILAKIKEVNTENLPFALTGDFNLEDDSESIKLLGADLSDAKKVAKKVSGPVATFNNFNTDEPATKRIDYIFVPKNGVDVTNYRVIEELKSNRYPSDHFPVYVELKVK